MHLEVHTLNPGTQRWKRQISIKELEANLVYKASSRSPVRAT